MGRRATRKFEVKKECLPDFEKLLLKYNPFINRIVGNFFRDPGTRDDVAQEIRMSLASAFLKIRPETEVSFVGNIARNECINGLRKRRRLNELSILHEMEETLAKDIKGRRQKTPQEILSSREAEKRISKIIANLSQKQREALIVFSSLPSGSKTRQKDAAKLLGISEVILRGRLSMAREEIHKQLENRG